MSPILPHAFDLLYAFAISILALGALAVPVLLVIVLKRLVRVEKKIDLLTRKND